MTAAFHFCTCCQRYFDAEGSVVALSVSEGAAVMRAQIERNEGGLTCGMDDCAHVAAELAERDAQRKANRAARRTSNIQHPTSNIQRPARACARSAPYQPSSYVARTVPEEREERDVPSNSAEPEAVTAREFNQRDFEAAGVADSANALLVAWFNQPKNFRVWFTKKFLEESVMLGKSGCCNNRALDCRRVFNEAGLDIDNRMASVDGKLQSQYRLCKIEESERLTAEEKAKLLAGLPT